MSPARFVLNGQRKKPIAGAMGWRASHCPTLVVSRFFRSRTLSAPRPCLPSQSGRFTSPMATISPFPWRETATNPSRLPGNTPGSSPFPSLDRIGAGRNVVSFVTPFSSSLGFEPGSFDSRIIRLRTLDIRIVHVHPQRVEDSIRLQNAISQRRARHHDDSLAGTCKLGHQLRRVHIEIHDPPVGQQDDVVSAQFRRQRPDTGRDRGRLADRDAPAMHVANVQLGLPHQIKPGLVVVGAIGVGTESTRR